MPTFVTVFRVEIFCQIRVSQFGSSSLFPLNLVLCVQTNNITLVAAVRVHSVRCEFIWGANTLTLHNNDNFNCCVEATFAQAEVEKLRRQRDARGGTGGFSGFQWENVVII
jgi:hypothetical protein